MSNLFIFTAENESARKHLDVSVLQPIQSLTVLNSFGADEHDNLEAIEKQGPGFYAWGAKPGELNEPNWEKMSPGDWVLCVFENAYHYVARVLGKFRNATLAKNVWKTDSDGKTWEYVYFLTKPREINIPVARLTPDLHESYRGFTKISDERIQQVVLRHGSLDKFIEERLLSPAIDLRSAEVLRALYDEFLQSTQYSDWWNRLSSFLDDVANSNEALRQTIAFQKLIWDDNPVSATGQGSVSVDNAIEDQAFRELIARESLEHLPDDPSVAIERLKTIRTVITERLRPFCTRIPHLKIFRVLAVFFPRHFTCVADRARLRKLQNAMFENPGEVDSVRRHSIILKRLAAC